MNLEDRISEVLGEYARVSLPALPLSPALSLRDDLAIESLSLVSIVVRLGEEFGVDIMDSALELSTLATVKDLFALGRTLQNSVQQ